jgi:membrane-associated protease RseP (regulator of RpoE activity)
MSLTRPRTFAGCTLLLAASLASAQSSAVTVRVDNIDGQARMAVVQTPQKPDGAGLEASPSSSPRRTPSALARRTGQTMGVYVSPVPPAMAAQLRLKPPIGLVVEALIPGGAAERAGIQQYDVISGIDGKPVSNPQQVERVLAQHKTGEEIPVDVIREGHRQTLRIAVQPRPETDASDSKYLPLPDGSQGFGSFKVKPEDRQKLNEMSDRLKSEIEKQEKRIEELTARIRAEAEQAKRQIQDLKEQIRREAQQQKEQFQRDLKNQDDRSDDNSPDKPRRF